MRIKHFQRIADLERHYTEIEREFVAAGDNESGLLGTWNITSDDRGELLEEAEVLRYLIGCELGFTHDTSAYKPSLEVANRLFDRHIAFLEHIFGINAYNVSKHNPHTQKEYKACTHYKFKFSLPAWYRNLPERILSIDEKLAL